MKPPVVMKSLKRTRKEKKNAKISTAQQVSPVHADSSDGYRKGGFPIVGIGASAGGLEALNGLLKPLDPDLGMAFIFVPHLDPSRESAFTQILARTTTMPVLQIKDDMKVQPNHLYVIPPNCDLTISDATLHISDRNEP